MTELDKAYDALQAAITENTRLINMMSQAIQAQTKTLKSTTEQLTIISKWISQHEKEHEKSNKKRLGKKN